MRTFGGVTFENGEWVDINTKESAGMIQTVILSLYSLLHKILIKVRLFSETLFTIAGAKVNQQV